MGRYFVELKETAKKDLTKIAKAGNKSSIKKIERILIELSNHPITGTGNPEQLKHDLTGYWSRHINKKDEIIERPKHLVVLVSALGHYD